MSSRDNWERLVAAVLKREQIWQLCHEQSRSPSLSTVSSDFSGQILNFSSNSLEPISVSPSPPIPLINPYVPQVSNNASGRITRKLFSAWYRRRKHKDEYLVDIPEDIGNHLPQVRRFSLRELKVATDNFSDKNVLQYRYKARLADGSLVGVKRLKHEGSSQSAEVRFQRELEINSIVAHSNVLDVLGFCISPKERLLVYPLMVNGSVASCLWGRPKSQSPLDWPLRKGIALGTARGLAYLHEECSQKIIHRDIKAANILLDEDFEAFIADFELAIIMDHDVIDIEETVRGTIGHIAPEYLSTGRCSEKTDVFGYGMFLLELITGQRAFELARLANDEDMMLLDWVKRNFEGRKWEMMVDPDCGGMYIDKEVRQLMQVTLLCTQSHPDKRPKMSEVVRMLKDVDGLGERWEERCNEVEMFCEEDLGIHLGRVWRFSLHELQPEKVKKNLEERKWEMLVDPDGRGIHMEEEVVEQLTQIALLCTQSNPERRPKMSEIVRMLQVGEFLAERWEECCNIEMFLHDVENQAYSSNIIFNDDISNVRPDEISGPSSDRIFYDDISTVQPDELSGPR